MSLPKLFNRIFFNNNTTPAVNADNLNAISKGLSDVDDRVIELGANIIEVAPKAAEVEQFAGESEAWAVGTRDGEPVPSSDPAYNNNAKYWVNRVKHPIVLTKTLAANTTTVTFTGLPTTGNNMIDFFTSDGSDYIGIDTSTTGQVTLTFNTKNSSRTVNCRIEEV